MDVDLEKNVKAIVFSVLGKKEELCECVLEKSTEPAWDSMKHIEIILALEENLAVSFEPEDIPLLTSLEKIVSKVKELHAE